MNTFATLFTGIGGADLGLANAGFTPSWAVEWNQGAINILKANHNIPTIIRDDVCNVSYSSLPEIDLLWASPVCCNFSGANHNGGEKIEDLHLAHAVVNAATRARSVIIENVLAYQNSDSFKFISEKLSWMGLTRRKSFGLEASHYGNPSRRTRFYAIFSEKELSVDSYEIEDYLEGYESRTNWVDELLKCRKHWVESELTDNQQNATNADRSKPISGSIYAIERCGYYKLANIYNSLSAFPCLKSHPHHDGKNPKPGYGKIGSYRRQYDFVYEGQSYTLTPQLMGVLMGFPIDYDWGDNKAQAAAGIGNAVVPKMAEIMAGLISKG
jgi:DNA-cytosine methyltransferase